MVRPATLDRVENGGPGSDNNPRERKIGGPHSTTEPLPARDHPACRRARSCQGAAWKRRSASPWRSDGPVLTASARDGPALTASARDGVGNLRSGRKKACGAVEQKKGAQTKKVSQQERKRLRSWRRLENEETALGKETGKKRTGAHQISPSLMPKSNPPGR